ncbi:NAD(P)-binding protein [Paraphaeosphaeria sporulosa]|uniref:NAD(P)-binding protein n=1 Tax=Paraphaeosphaeria sporulosa TaxID=1460663 RepID=A0A177CTL2_9PLEO|nr:NAD(P)-binding protein [Paraphaeosphaeria sporulosa]OAG10875.1 NAD(P)-binding protein [Paraphaeosphaeria sporulosa]
MANHMIAWTHSRRGPPDEVLTLSTLPVPALARSNQVRVKITHCALNPGASIIMQLLPFIFRVSTAIPEMDFAGIVDAIGIEVPPERDLTIGRRVFGSIPVSQHAGTLSGALGEYVVVDHQAVVTSPEGLESHELAGLPIAGSTAIELVQAAELKRGDSVLVNGSAGGIGHLALQMCREQVGETGKVVAICSKENLDWVKRLGADEVIDRTAHCPLHEHLKVMFGSSRFDAVIDAAGVQELFNTCPEILKEGKPYVTVGPRPGSYTILGMLSMIKSMAENLLWPKILGGVARDYRQVTGIATPKAMADLVKMVQAGTLKVHVGTLVKIEQAKQGYDKLLKGSVSGKIVVEVSQ